MGIVCLFHCQNETQINSCISNANFICFIPRHSHSHQNNNRREHVLAFTASKFFPRLAIFLLKWAKIQCIQCLQSFPFSVAILLHCHCESVLRASCPGPIAIPIPNAARQLARLLLRLEFVSLSASRVGDEVGGGGVAKGAAAVHLPLACLCFCYSFILICLPLRFIFLRFFSLPAPFHSFSPFSPHFVSHFSCSFNLENSEKRAQSNKIKLGFIDPFQFDSLTPPLLLLLPLDCFLPSVSICSFFFFFCSSLGCPVGFAFVQQLN